MILKKKTLKNNTSNRKLISHSNYFRLKFNLNIFVGKLCAVMMNTLQGKGRGGERRGGEVVLRPGGQLIAHTKFKEK